MNIDILDRAIWRYGVGLQLDMAVEEMSELTKEICKSKRGKENVKEILEEIADVKIMLKQLEMIFNITPDAVNSKISEKIERLKNRMEEEV